MGVEAGALAARLRAAPSLSPARVAVEDVSGGCGSAFAIEVVSAAFGGVRALQRHRMLHALIGDDMPDIHALQLTCLTPAQADARAAKANAAAAAPAAAPAAAADADAGADVDADAPAAP